LLLFSAGSSRLFVQYAHGRRRLGDQRAVLVLRFALDEAHAAAVLQHARIGVEPLAAPGVDERRALIDGDHADRLRMERARRGAERDIEERHDDAAMHRAETIGEVRLDRYREPRRAFAEAFGADLQMLDERDALLIITRELERLIFL